MAKSSNDRTFGEKAWDDTKNLAKVALLAGAAIFFGTELFSNKNPVNTITADISDKITNIIG